jgi:hypothetical protein
MIAAKINELDGEGQTVLFHAASRGYQDICKVLLDRGADLNFRDKVGKSALHMAIAANQYATVKFLLESGANTTGVDMRQIRFWSMSNISTRIDNLLKKYPPKPLRTSKLKRSPIEGLTLKEFALQKKIFKFFDLNQDVSSENAYGCFLWCNSLLLLISRVFSFSLLPLGFHFRG